VKFLDKTSQLARKSQSENKTTKVILKYFLTFLIVIDVIVLFVYHNQLFVDGGFQSILQSLFLHSHIIELWKLKLTKESNSIFKVDQEIGHTRELYDLETYKL